MLYHGVMVVFWLSALCLLCLTSSTRPARWSYAPGLVWLSALGVFLSFQAHPERPTIHRFHPPVAGVQAGLKLGLWTQSLLPPPAPTQPVITWLKQTQGGRSIIQKPIVLFRSPAQAAFRREGVNFSFLQRFGWCCALQRDTEPRAIIVHSTEGENEAHAFAIFDRNSGDQYLGGIWTHFAVGPAGEIYQYGPLNRISKGQAGFDDQGVGIEIVGSASLWQDAQQIKTGSIMQRYQGGDTRQFLAVLDLIRTLQNHYAIPSRRIYSHEDLGHIRERIGLTPDYQWLREHIRDGVYLSKVPTVDEQGTPRQYYDFLEPYDRQDPGRDLMELLRQRL